MKTKRITITIGNQYLSVDLQFRDDDIEDESEELIAYYGFLGAYAIGGLQIDIQDIDDIEHHKQEMNPLH